jgi:mRNA interferase RelE/StbE
LGWSIEYSGLALKQLKKLNRSVQAEILNDMDNRIATAVNPRNFGKSLRHDKFGLWRYRVGITASSANWTIR